VGRDRDSGVAIILALLFVIIAGGLVASGTMLMKSATDRSEVRFRREAQAMQFARSGLTEALSWMRRQPGQPVTDFAPQLDISPTPPILDTDDPVIGLVREFQIADDIWGRYEVWREDEADTDPIRLDFRRKYQCEDMSVTRGFSGLGNVWLLRSLGYVIQKRDLSKAWNVRPNRVLAMTTLEGEIQRLSLQPPAQSAISVADGNGLHINTKARVRGGATGAGVFYPTGSGTPTTGPAGETRVTGSPALSASATYNDSLKSVFGVTRDELRSMADLVITSANDFPDPVPANAIVFVEVNSITFDAARSLNGTAIVYIEGNVSMISGNNSSFSGLLYIDGTFTMRETSDIYGALVVTGNATMQGSGDSSSVYYDDDVLAALRTQIGQYRWTGALRTVINQE
jgi:hypothetical protein